MAKAEPKKTGRPSKYRAEYCAELQSHMEKGYSFESFAGAISVDRDTLYEWVKTRPEFSDAKKVGIEKGRLFWERISILAVAGKVPGFNATAWIFTMKNRFEWKDRQEVSGETTHRGEIKLTIRDYTAKK